MENILEEKQGLEKLYVVMKMYYNDLDNLTQRLQKDYTEEEKFEQSEQDRLALSMILDVFEEIER